MQASALLLRWGSYRWARNLWVLIIYLFSLLVMLPSVVPRLAADSAVRVFPGVWKPLLILRLPSRDRAPSWEGNLKNRGSQTPGNTLTAESVASLGSTEGNITGRKNK